MAQQTAVNYFKDELIKQGFFVPGGIYAQAKAMEKEYIKTAFIHGSYTGCGCYDYMEDVDADEYYNNTYGKDKPNNEKG
jgi:hypothetical protein